jgi:hypothetical protein
VERGSAAMPFVTVTWPPMKVLRNLSFNFLISDTCSSSLPIPQEKGLVGGEKPGEIIPPK